MISYMEILDYLKTNPGTTKPWLCELFHLNKFRLNRALRDIEKEISNIRVIHSVEHGIWIVEMDSRYCMGVAWKEESEDGFCQCDQDPVFGDNRCYEHTDYESPEMLSFERELVYITGIHEPNAFIVSQLHSTEVQKLLTRLNTITPGSKKEDLKKRKLTAILKSALARRKWKERARRQLFEEWIPDDVWRRHQRSSSNPFEAAIKKYFIILEVTTEATKEEVLRAWKRLARKYHPDIESGNEERMKQINAAKERIFRIRRWD